jgi:putative ABC transport system permease protein
VTTSQIRQSLRALARDRSFTFAAVATLALGLGATLAVCSVFEAVLLRPLPYRDAERLVVLNHHDARTGITKDFVARGDVIDIRARSRTLDRVGTYGAGEVTVYGQGDPFRADALFATAPVFEMLGFTAALGRGLVAEDSRPGAAPVAVLGHALWRERFGGDPAAVGRSVTVGEQSLTIVGVAPAGTVFPPNAETGIIVAAALPLEAGTQRRSWTLAMARLRPGVTVDAARAEIAALSRELEREFGETNAGSSYLVLPLRDALVGNTKQALVLLFAAVGVVLLIACANVASLLLGRAHARRRETAVRIALGAGRPRLLGQALVEAGAVSVLGVAVGLPVAHWGARALVRLVPDSVSVPGLAGVTLDLPVFAVATALAVAATIAFACVGALGARWDRVGAALVTGTRSSAGVRARGTASTIVVAEIAFAVVLLFGATLVLRSFAALLGVSPGFETEGVATVDVALPADRYAAPAARAAFYDRAFAALRALPGVTDVGAAAVTPLTGNNWTLPLERPEKPLPAGERPPEVGWQVASGGFFRALRIPLRAGRHFDATDRPDGPPVVIVSEALARQHFPGEQALGRRVRLGDGTAEIVGVVGDIRRASLADDPRPDMYLPFERAAAGQATLFVRTRGDAAASASAIEAALRGVEPTLIVADAGTMREVARSSLAIPRLLLALLALFAALAVLLAMVGIYGVMAYAVQQRAREIGTRLALGARPGQIQLMVLRRGLRVALAGGAAGLAVGALGSRVLASLLYGTSAADPVVLAAVPAALGVATVLACLVPARRASAVDPARTLGQS